MTNSRSQPNEGQLAVLDNEVGARIRVVSAAPGSGKTWLVGEVIRRELATWDSGGGLAALSFTNVARDAVSEALGGRLPSHPHFVGTLDSFVYRYVFRAFGPSVDPKLARLRLVPAEVSDNLRGKWGGDALTIEIEKRRVSLFEIHLRRFEEEGLQLSYKVAQMGEARPVPPSERNYVLRRKRDLWRDRGIASHSDLAYLAWTLVTHAKDGPTVCDLLAKRFPLLLLDEVQDTGWFLGEVICSLLRRPGVRGLIVGDRDQAIYQFGGAHPADLDRFESLPGAVAFPMRESLRCSRAVCRVGSSLSWQGAEIEHSPGAVEGRAVLYVFDEMPDVEVLAADLEQEAAGTPVTVLVRRRSTLDVVLGPQGGAPEFGSRTLRHLWNGCRHLHAGDTVKALSAARASVCACMFGVEAPPTGGKDDESIAQKIRRTSAALLIGTMALSPDLDAYDWGVGALGILRRLLGDLADDKAVSKMLRRPNRTKTQGVAIRDRLTVRDFVADRRCTTIHGAKGETHGVTLLLVPKPKLKRHCPSRTWFDSEGSTADEERRVAFVAATRPREAFALCVHRSTYDALGRLAPEFVGLFDVREC